MIPMDVERLIGTAEASEAPLAPRKMMKVTKDGNDTKTLDVAFDESSLKSEDVLVVDDGHDVWLWVGEKVTHKVDWALDAAYAYARPTKRSTTAAFEKDGKDSTFREAFEKTLATPLMFEVTIEGKTGELVPVAFDEANLDSSKAFIVDTGKDDGLFIWLGKDTLEKTKAFVDEANTYDNRANRGLIITDEKRISKHFEAVFHKDEGTEGDSGDVDNEEQNSNSSSTKEKSGVPKFGVGCALVLAASSFCAN